MPLQRHVSRPRLTHIIILFATLFQSGCGRERGTFTPPKDLIAYGLHASNDEADDADGDQPIVAGVSKLHASGTLWTDKPVLKQVMIKVQKITANGSLISMDTGFADVQPSGDQKYRYRSALNRPKKPGTYILRTFYGSNVVDEALFKVVKR